MTLPQKTGRHRANGYTRRGRLLKQRVALLLAPKISDFDLDRPRLGMSDQQIARELWPEGDDVIVVTHINSGRAASTAARVTQER